MYRYTIEYLASGQLGPYKDSQTHVRLTCEVFQSWLGDPNHENSGWKPNVHLEEKLVREQLKGMRCGFTEVTAETRNHGLDTYLVYLKKTTPGVWEFYTITPYYD